MPALQQLKEFAELIRVEAVKLLKEDYALSHLHFKAFEGPLAGCGKTFFSLFRSVDFGVWNILQLARKSHLLRSGQAISPCLGISLIPTKIVLSTGFTQRTSEFFRNLLGAQKAQG
jgi:hypothetical protein